MLQQWQVATNCMASCMNAWFRVLARYWQRLVEMNLISSKPQVLRSTLPLTRDARERSCGMLYWWGPTSPKQLSRALHLFSLGITWSNNFMYFWKQWLCIWVCWCRGSEWGCSELLREDAGAADRPWGPAAHQEVLQHSPRQQPLYRESPSL